MREMIVKNSSNVERIRHWKNNVTVDFKGGASYSYIDVSKEHVDGLFEAESIGKYVVSVLRKFYQTKKEDEYTLYLIDCIIEDEKSKSEDN